MTPKSRKYRFYLEDMCLSMERIQTYIENLDFSEFKHQMIVIDAVVRNFEIIGEAAKHIPEHIVNKYPEIPWKKCTD